MLSHHHISPDRAVVLDSEAFALDGAGVSSVEAPSLTLSAGTQALLSQYTSLVPQELTDTAAFALTGAGVEVAGVGEQVISAGHLDLGVSSAVTATVQRVAQVTASVGVGLEGAGVQTTGSGQQTLSAGTQGLSVQTSVAVSIERVAQTQASVGLSIDGAGVSTSGGGTLSLSAGMQQLSIGYTSTETVVVTITITSADVQNIFSDQWQASASWEATTGPYEADVYQGDKGISVYSETGITDTSSWSSDSFGVSDQTDTNSFEIVITDANGNTGSTVVDTSNE